MHSKSLADEMLESLRSITDAEADAVWEEMIRDGFIDRDGNVLKRFPEPPDWLTQANGRSKSEFKPEKPIKKSKRPRKRS